MPILFSVVEIILMLIFLGVLKPRRIPIILDNKEPLLMPSLLDNGEPLLKRPAMVEDQVLAVR